MTTQQSGEPRDGYKLHADHPTWFLHNVGGLLRVLWFSGGVVGFRCNKVHVSPRLLMSTWPLARLVSARLRCCRMRSSVYECYQFVDAFKRARESPPLGVSSVSEELLWPPLNPDEMWYITLMGLCTEERRDQHRSSNCRRLIYVPSIHPFIY